MALGNLSRVSFFTCCTPNDRFSDFNITFVAGTCHECDSTSPFCVDIAVLWSIFKSSLCCLSSYGQQSADEVLFMVPLEDTDIVLGAECLSAFTPVAFS